MTPRPSSVIAPARYVGDALEIYWTQRRHDMKFLGGYHAFFGGAVEDGDAAVPLARAIDEGFPAHEYYGCAMRELFEEVGVLVAAEGIYASGLDKRVRGLREALVRGDIDFDAVIETLGVTLDPDRFLPIGEWITPDFSPIRFQSEFFVVLFTDDELSRLEAHDFEDALQIEELIAGEWVSPADGLRRWRDGEAYLTPPIRYVFEAMLTQDLATLHVDDSAAASIVDYAEATGGIYMLPLRSATIPPATHTNCVIVGDEHFVIIDPGSDLRGEVELLDRAIAENIEVHGREPLAILLTHHHPDHIDGVAHLKTTWNLPLWGHARTADRLQDLVFERFLDDGDVLEELGADALTVLHTPGHADGHLAFFHQRTGVLVAGDLIASFSTILIDPRDGSIGDYLASLERVRDQVRPRALLPSHGWLVTSPDDVLGYYIDHRLGREEKVYEALVSFGKPASPEDLLPMAYDDAPRRIWPIAARSALSHLIHLVEVGRARAEGSRFVAL